MNQKRSKAKFVFFGTSDFSASVLDILKGNGLLPSLVVTTEDKPRGRGLNIEPTPVKLWAQANSVPVFQPESLRTDAASKQLEGEKADLFVVVSYGKILPKNIFEIPAKGTINLHPSLLPRLRGASPIESTLLLGEQPGVTIMLIDEEMDAGPILAQEKIDASGEIPTKTELQEILIKRGGKLLSETIDKWLKGEIKPRLQDDRKATYTAKIKKEDGLINMNAGAEENLRKLRAFEEWPGAYMFFKDNKGKNIRIIIKDARISGGVFIPLVVVPEGKKEMLWSDFLRGHKGL